MLVTASSPLAGKRIAVTRPRQQAAALAQMIVHAGGEAVLAPLLEIDPPTDTSRLLQAREALDQYAMTIFISPNAVEYSLPVLLAQRAWPVSLMPVALGQGTVRMLAARGIPACLAPTVRFDSESLLALPELQQAQVAGRRILILRGDGGRELLAETLTARGALVDLVSCYRRSPPVAGLEVLRLALQAENLAALTLSSSEGMRYLADALNATEFAALCRIPVFVSHARIAENAKNIGICHTVLTEPTDEGLLAGLYAYNWH